MPGDHSEHGNERIPFPRNSILRKLVICPNSKISRINTIKDTYHEPSETPHQNTNAHAPFHKCRSKATLPDILLHFVFIVIHNYHLSSHKIDMDYTRISLLPQIVDFSLLRIGCSLSYFHYVHKTQFLQTFYSPRLHQLHP